jgi:phosphoserine phosphatase
MDLYNEVLEYLDENGDCTIVYSAGNEEIYIRRMISNPNMYAVEFTDEYGNIEEEIWEGDDLEYQLDNMDEMYDGIEIF